MLQQLAQCGQYAGKGCLNAVYVSKCGCLCVWKSNWDSLFVVWFLPDLHYEAPKGGQGCMMAPFPPVWNLRTVFWFPFPISSLLFLPSSSCSVCHFSAGTFSWLFFLQKTLKYFSLRNRLFVFVFWYGSCWEARTWQLVDSMCSLLRFGTCIYHYALCNFFFFFCPFLFGIFLCQVSIN